MRWRHDDESFGCLSVPLDWDSEDGGYRGGGFFVAGTWYKDRGATGTLVFLRDAEYHPLTLSEAESAIRILKYTEED